MVKILLCRACRELGKRGEHLDMYGTGTSILYGCKHAVLELKSELAEQVRTLTTSAPGAGQAKGKRRPLKAGPLGDAIEVVRYSKIEFRDGSFSVKGSPLRRPGLRPVEGFQGW